MSAATATSLLLAALVAFAAARKLTHSPSVVAGYARAGVPEERLNLLAAVLLSAAGGLLAGLLWAPIGIATAGCLVAYFAVAIAFHLRNRDAANGPTPAVMLALSAVTFALLVAAA